MHVPPGALGALPKTCAAVGAAILALGAGAGSAHAAGSTQVGEGLHIATGALVDPNGRTWVSDHNAGFCRVSQPTDDGPGVIEHPQSPGEPGLKTCLGGLLPDPQPGPDAAGAPAFLDPSPEFPGSGDELAFIPDGASPSSEVVRAQWNRHTGRFEFKDTVTMRADRGRPVAASVGPDGNVYVSFQRETTIQRITEAASEAPIPEIVGVPADGIGAAAVAAGRDADGELAVYVAESTGVRVLRPDPATVPSTQPAYDVPAPGGLAVSALSYDLERDLLWAGTATGTTEADAGKDALVRIDTATGEVDAAHATGFSMVGGVAAKPDGKVLVLDDPALLDPAEPMSTGRLFHVGLPAAHVVKGPIDDAGQEARDRVHTSDKTPAFEVTGDGTVECLLRGDTVDTGWEACATGLHTVGQELADGRYTLSVRSRQDGVTGLAEARRFTVDSQAPLPPSIVRPADGTTVSGSPWFEFDSEPGAAFVCRFDAEDAQPCSPGRTRTFDAAGTHTLAVGAVDAAGNAGELSAPVTFTVDPTLEPNTPTGWSDGTPTHRGSSLYTSGLHISAGALVDPNGRTWVADHNGGFCRVTEPGENGAGAIEHPQVPGDLGLRTCLGGLLPNPGTGPDAAGQPTLVDPTSDRPGSGDEVALIPDGASPSSDVVRARWNPDSGLFEYLDTITMIGDRARPVAVSLGPDGAAYVVFQRSGTIQRISDPAGDNPVVATVGLTSDGRGAATVAAGRDSAGRLTVYVAEATGLRSLIPNAGTPRATQPSIALPGAPSIGALIYDTKRDHLWVGTANGLTPADEGADVVHRIDIATGGIEEGYAKGYSMVGGFGLRPDGILFVLDDPAILDPAEPMGTGRMFHVGLPAAHVTRGPLLDDGSQAADRRFVSDATPTFLVEGDEVVQCRLSAADQPGEWQDCPEGGSFTPAEPLADGEYTMAVRSVIKPVAPVEAVPASEGVEAVEAVEEVKEVIGLVEVHRFTVDTSAPAKPSITSPTGGIVSASPWFEFEAEPEVRFECSWDDAPAFAACVPGRTRAFSENETHTLKIRAIDRAGNVSAESDTVSFDAHGRATKVTIDSGPEGRTRDNSPTFRFSADAPGVEFSCRISGQSFAFCADGSKSYTNLVEGTYSFEVRAKDGAGNITPVVKRTFTVDRTAPVMSVTSPAEGARTGTSVTLAMKANEAATWRCRLDGEAFADCGDTRTYSDLADGEHVFEVVATDEAGNVGPALTRRFTVERGFVAPAPPADPPAEPTVTVIDQVTQLPLTIRVVDIDRRVKLERIQQAGIRVTVRPATGAKLIRFRIFKVRDEAGAAAAAKPVATVYRKARKGTNRIRLTRQELRRVKAGTYRMEIRTGTKRTTLGKAVTKTFRVTR